MESEVLKNVHDYFSTTFRQQIAMSVDEEGHAVDKALSAIIPAGLTAAIHHAGTTDGGSFIYRLANGAVNYYPGTQDVGLMHNEDGAKMAADLLGGQERVLRHGVAKYAGIKNESAAQIMYLAIPAFLRSLGHYAKTNNLNQDGMNHYLNSQKDQLAALVPQGFEPVVQDLQQDAPAVEKDVVEAIATDSPKRKNRAWILPIVLAAIILLMLIYFSRGTTYLK